MTVKQRSPGQTAISISLSANLLDSIDTRTKALGLNRSQYLLALAKKDIAAGGTLELRDSAHPHNVSSPKTTDRVLAAVEAVDREDFAEIERRRLKRAGGGGKGGARGRARAKKGPQPSPKT